MPLLPERHRPSRPVTAVATNAKYVAIDVVDYSRVPTARAQAEIVATMNFVVHEALDEVGVPDDRRLLLPAGDGVFVALLDLHEPFDIDVRFALGILERLAAHRRDRTGSERPFDLRVALNEHVDVVTGDVNGRRNMAGDGINVAARLLGLADGGQILLGDPVHARLRTHGVDPSRFRSFEYTVKHGRRLHVHQLVGTGRMEVDERLPYVFDIDRQFEQESITLPPPTQVVTLGNSLEGRSRFDPEDDPARGRFDNRFRGEYTIIDRELAAARRLFERLVIE